MVNAEGISDDMAYLVPSEIAGANRSALMEMRDEGVGNEVYSMIADKVVANAGRSDWNIGGDFVMNDAFIELVISARPLTNGVLIGLGRSFILEWD